MSEQDKLLASYYASLDAAVSNVAKTAERRGYQLDQERLHELCDTLWLSEIELVKMLRLAQTDSVNSLNQPSEDLERILEIVARMSELLRGDTPRLNRWLRRAYPGLDGMRPIDILTEIDDGIDVLSKYVDGLPMSESHAL